MLNAADNMQCTRIHPDGNAPHCREDAMRFPQAAGFDMGWRDNCIYLSQSTQSREDLIL